MMAVVSKVVILIAVVVAMVKLTGGIDALVPTRTLVLTVGAALMVILAMLYLKLRYGLLPRMCSMIPR